MVKIVEQGFALDQTLVTGNATSFTISNIPQSAVSVISISQRPTTQSLEPIYYFKNGTTELAKYWHLVRMYNSSTWGRGSASSGTTGYFRPDTLYDPPSGVWFHTEIVMYNGDETLGFSSDCDFTSFSQYSTSNNAGIQRKATIRFMNGSNEAPCTSIECSFVNGGIGNSMDYRYTVSMIKKVGY